MNNTNIPHGYDENGVRAGNGDWKKDFVQEDELVECVKCDKTILIEEATKLENNYLCDTCVRELGFDI